MERKGPRRREGHVEKTVSRKAAKITKRKHLKDLEVFIMNPVPFFAPLAPLREANWAFSAPCSMRIRSIRLGVSAGYLFCKGME